MSRDFFGDFSLYIHIPYCVSKCAYCDFLSFCDRSTMAGYFDALCAEIRLKGKLYKDKKVNSIYIGGGTPSIAYEFFPKLRQAIFDSFIVMADAEISVECNPESVSSSFIDAAKALGVNRVSVGVQSLSDVLLNRIGRAHNREKALRSVETLTKHFSRVNADVMVGLPNEEEADVCETIDTLLSFDLSHYSCYSLILEPGTPLFREAKRGTFVLDEDEAVDMYDLVSSRLLSNGYHRYEVSNFAKKDEECRYNLSVWEYSEYLGLGLGASSFLKGYKDSFGRRFVNAKDLVGYLGGKRATVRKVTLNEAKKEFIMLGLRLERGLSLFDYYTSFGTEFLHDYAKQVASSSEFLRIKNGYVSVNPEYLYVMNNIISDII